MGFVKEESVVDTLCLLCGHEWHACYMFVNIGMPQMPIIQGIMELGITRCGQEGK